MSRPSRRLATAVAIAGGLILVLAAALQVLVIDEAYRDATQIGRGISFATYVVNGLTTAGALVLAAGIVMALVVVVDPDGRA
ncbi:MAG: hypothetical protein JHC74_06430 [Thermoleophilia bacterium]|nr:hypothetical protein [Thermoleophilia bacterium]